MLGLLTTADDVTSHGTTVVIVIGNSVHWFPLHSVTTVVVTTSVKDPGAVVIAVSDPSPVLTDTSGTVVLTDTVTHSPVLDSMAHSPVVQAIVSVVCWVFVRVLTVSAGPDGAGPVGVVVSAEPEGEADPFGAAVSWVFVGDPFSGADSVGVVVSTVEALVGCSGVVSSQEVSAGVGLAAVSTDAEDSTGAKVDSTGIVSSGSVMVRVTVLVIKVVDPDTEVEVVKVVMI